MIILLNRLPIPNLKHYCVLSFSLFFLVIIYAYKIFNDLNNQINTLASTNHDTSEPNDASSDPFDEDVQRNGTLKIIYRTVTNEPWCIWVLINFCYCGFLLISKVIQGIIFGKLRAVENQHIKDQFWNFIFLKFIFIFGVLNLENLNDVIMWCTWFSIIGFLSIHCQICKDRFEYLSFSASTPLKSHLKVFSLLVFIQFMCAFLVVVSLFAYKTIGLSLSLFMFSESFGLTLRTLYVITRYIVHLCDIYNLAQLTNKGSLNYYIDFTFEIGVVTIDFLHYLHMLIYGNFYLSMASLVICMELKRLFFDLKKRMKRHSNYLRVIEKMEKKFPWATKEELVDSDKCAVCWEKLDEARRLPCSHIFHHNCLRSWLEQDTSCPTCRKSLQDDKEIQQQSAAAFLNTANLEANIQQPQAQQAQQQQQQQPQQQQQQPQQPVQPQFTHRNLFHFDGSRYISWLPSFSLQVTNGGAMLPALLRSTRASLEPERLNEMTAQVSQMFPHVGIDLIQQDLRQTHSVEITVENILENRLNRSRNNTNNQMNLNEIDETDPDEDEDDYEDNTSSEDDSNNNNNLGNQLNPTQRQISNDSNRPVNRRRNNNIFSNILFRSNNNTEPTVNNNTEYNQLRADPNSNDNPTETSDGTTTIISKYSTSPSLSESANSLMLRKRELILNSKKRFLDRTSTSKDVSLAKPFINEDNTVTQADEANQRLHKTE